MVWARVNIARVTVAHKPHLELIWRNPAGRIQRKLMLWRRATTSEALSEYMDDYLALLDDGYRPKDFNYTPIPHCARVYQSGRVLAEWYLRPGARPESLVTGQVSQAGEASPQLYPSPARTAPPIEQVPVSGKTADSQPRQATGAASGIGIPAA